MRVRVSVSESESERVRESERAREGEREKKKERKKERKRYVLTELKKEIGCGGNSNDDGFYCNDWLKKRSLMGQILSEAALRLTVGLIR